MSAKLQIALDFTEITRAMKVARAVAGSGADILEAGTPLIKSEGLDSVRALRKEFPRLPIVADLKTMDTGRIEVEAAAKAGARVAIVMGAASDATIKECIEAGEAYGVEIGVDLLGVADPAKRAREVEEWGAHHIGIHTAIDEQMQGLDPFRLLREVRKAVSIPIAVAGGINSETAADAVKAGADIIIVGGAVTKSKDPAQATKIIKKAIETKAGIKTDLYKRVTEEDVRSILSQVSTANISDGYHRIPGLVGIMPVVAEAKAIGPAITVRTYPGDWAKPVEAIDEAGEGDVIVIDAGGKPPAVWGELATHSAVEKKLGGVVIDGAIRDVAEIRELKFPAFARIITPAAGEPKGFGEIGPALNISGVAIRQGDWVVGDADGVVVIPRERLTEITNRAMEWLEKENRIRQEIVEGKTTLAQVMELLRWEKK